jgi:hypothetical protein
MLRLHVADVETTCSSERFLLDQQISSFWRKIFWNKMCQSWSKQPENKGIWALYMRLPLISSVNIFISDLKFGLHMIMFYWGVLFKCHYNVPYPTSIIYQCIYKMMVLFFIYNWSLFILLICMLIYYMLKCLNLLCKEYIRFYIPVG